MRRTRSSPASAGRQARRGDGAATIRIAALLAVGAASLPVAASSLTAVAAAYAADRGPGHACTTAAVRADPGAPGRLKVIGDGADGLVWLVRTSRVESLYACVRGSRARHVIDRAVTGNGLTESLTDVRVVGGAIGAVFTSSDAYTTTVSLAVARADGTREASEAVGQEGSEPQPGGGPVGSSVLGSWALDAEGDLAWSEQSTAVDGATETELIGLAWERRQPVDPVDLAAGGPFKDLGLRAGTVTWASPSGRGRVDLRAATTLEKPPHPLGPCALLAPAEIRVAVGATSVPEPIRAAGSCDYEGAQTDLQLSERFGPFGPLTSAELAGEEAGLAAGDGISRVGGLGDAAYLYTDGLGPVDLEVFRGAFELRVELFPNATVAGLETLASEVLMNVGY